MNANLTFLLEPASTLDTLEAILATARRGGLQLDALRVQPEGADNAVHMRVRGPDADMLDLFTLRLHNLMDVHAIERQSADICMID